MRSNWNRWREDDHPPVEMRFIDMFMTALGSLVFIALLLVFLLPKTTQKKDDTDSEPVRKEIAELTAENQRLRNQNATQSSSKTQTEDRDVVRRWFSVVALTEGCDAGDLELYVRWEGKVVDNKTNQPVADALPFDVTNFSAKTILFGNQYTVIGKTSQFGMARRNEPAAFRNEDLRGNIFNAVSRSAGTWSAYIGLRNPNAYVNKNCEVTPYYFDSSSMIAGDRITMRQNWPFAWLRRFKVNIDGTTSLGTAPNTDADFRRNLTDFSSKQSKALCEKSQLCGTMDAHLALLAPPPPVPAPRLALTQKQERDMKAGGSFVECDNCPEMVVVPSGAFVMGAPESESGSAADERPQTIVRIGDGLAVGRFPVTFDQWDACVADHGCDTTPTDEGWGRGNRPVINVSWNDAQAYVAWLTAKSGKTYRLLSEGEREYVARADSMTPFWWGASIKPEQANYDSTVLSRNDAMARGRLRTVVVDRFPPNPFGLYQVHGNVLEWLEDCYKPNYNDFPGDGSPRTQADCKVRVKRGGSWSNRPEALRSASRGRSEADARDRFTGFRVARRLRGE